MYTHLNRISWKVSLLAAAISLLAFTVVQAAPGDLDTTFSGDGKVTTDISGGMNDVLREIALQPDGKIVVVGERNDPVRAYDFAVARYNPNGTLDTTFSGDGKLLTNFGAVDKAEDVAIQPDGKIVVAGFRCLDEVWPAQDCDLVLARYQTNGALDPTFSGDGKVRTDFGGVSNGFWGGLAIQLNGKIVVNGWTWNGTDYDFAVYRYTSNGTLDPTFSGDGRVRVGFANGPQDMGNDLALQRDGKIVVSGHSCDTVEFENCDFAVLRLNANGSLDTTFSGDGRQTINFGGSESPEGVAVQSNGKIVLAGTKRNTTSVFALARLNSNGSLDTTFSGDGRVLTGFGPGIFAGCGDVRVQSNGKIVAAGEAGGDLALARYNANGSLDTTFSTDGKAKVDFGSTDYHAKLALQTNGRYMLAGNSQGDFALARVLP